MRPKMCRLNFTVPVFCCCSCTYIIACVRMFALDQGDIAVVTQSVMAIRPIIRKQQNYSLSPLQNLCRLALRSRYQALWHEPKNSHFA